MSRVKMYRTGSGRDNAKQQRGAEHKNGSGSFEGGLPGDRDHRGKWKVSCFPSGMYPKVPGIRYAVTSNGAAVYDLLSGELLRAYRMTAESVEAVLAVTERALVVGTWASG